MDEKEGRLKKGRYSDSGGGAKDSKRVGKKRRQGTNSTERRAENEEKG